MGKNSTIELKKVHGNTIFKNKRQVKDNRFGKSNQTMKTLRQLGATQQEFTEKSSERTVMHPATNFNHLQSHDTLQLPKIDDGESYPDLLQIQELEDLNEPKTLE